MSRTARRWILLCLALLFTASASYFEFLAVGAAWAASDVVNFPGNEQQALLAIREIQHEANIYTGEAVACLIIASLCLGIAWRRSNSKRPIAAYIKAFLVCPLVSLLPIYLTFLFINLGTQ